MSVLEDRGPEAPSAAASGPPTLDALLRRLVELEGSDLHLKPMRAPMIRLGGELQSIDASPLEPAALAAMLEPIIPERLQGRLAAEMAVEFGYGIPGVSRFRTAIYHQRGTRAAVFRRVAYSFPSLEDWGLPAVLGEFCDLPQGLVLATGPTGSGKSSTLAALIKRIANTHSSHIVTIEDPIEFLIQDNLASVSQREVGTDTPSFTLALHNALRQDPDVIMVGEMRDEEAIRTVLTAAETGHLVFSTLHTNSASQTVDRIVSSFPKGNHEHVRQQLAGVIEAVVSLQLVPRANGKGMVAAVEILRRSPRVTKLIQQGDLQSLEEELETSVSYYRMQSMNQSLVALVLYGTITREAAMAHSAKPDDLDLKLRSHGCGTDRAMGEAMAESTSDFSKILELQEIKKLHDEAQERHRVEIGARDREIGQLRQQLATLSAKEEPVEEPGRLAQLEAENQRLADHIQTSREEYEAKLERLNTRLRELTAKLSKDPAGPTERRGFFS